MIENIKEICKEFSNNVSYNKGHVITIHELFSQHADFLTVSFMLDRLTNGYHVTFLALRENYAHYHAISKKLGKSLETFLKSEQLDYYECFSHDLCSQLPLVETAPAVYIRPPKTVKTIKSSQISKVFHQSNLKPQTVLVVDAICFIEENPELCYFLFENAAKNGSQIILSGCLESSAVCQILRNEANFSIQLENDVGGSGKFKMVSEGKEKSLLWKWVQGKFQISNFMKL